MRMRVGRVRAVLLTASVLVLASGAAVAGNGIAGAGVASPSSLSRAARPAVVNTITVTSPGNQTTAPGTPVSLQIVATDSGAPTSDLTFSATGLPDTLTISPAGLITGTPTAANEAGSPYTVTVTATDPTDATGAATFSWTVKDNTITVTSPGGQTTVPGTPVSLQVAAADSGAPATDLTFSATGLPDTLTISPAGLITGTPTAANEAGSPYTVTVTATDPTDATGAATFSWTVKDNTITVTPIANQTSPPNTKVSLKVTAADSAAGQVLAYSATGLPPTLAISPTTGLITGTTSKAEVGHTYTVTVKVTNDTSEPGSATFAWSVADNKITVTVARTAQSEVGVTIVPVKIKAKDAAAGQRLTYAASPLPAGLAINHTTGVITGKPRALTSVLTSVTVTDGTGSTGGAVIRWQVGAKITIIDPGGQVLFLGQPVDLRLTAKANLTHYPLTLRVSGMPLGVGFQQRPLLSGWPMRAGTYHLVVTATGKDGGSATLRFPVTVRPAPDSGPTGVLILGSVGMCLDDPGNKSAVGTRVDIWTCDGSAAQNWTLVEDGTIRIHDRCLSIVSGTLRLAGCTAAPAQTWVKGTDAELVNPAAGRCLADPGSSARNGTRPVLAKCTAGENEQWSALGSSIFAGLMGRCADDHVSSGADGNVIDEFFCNSSIAQSWQLLPDGTLRIFGDKCMTVAGSAGRIGAKIELFTCAAGDASQRWRIVTHGSFVAEIENGGACLAVPGNNSPNGVQLRLARCAGNAPTDTWHD